MFKLNEMTKKNRKKDLKQECIHFAKTIIYKDDKFQIDYTKILKFRDALEKL